MTSNNIILKTKVNAVDIFGFTLTIFLIWIKLAFHVDVTWTIALLPFIAVFALTAVNHITMCVIAACAIRFNAKRQETVGENDAE